MPPAIESRRNTNKASRAQPVRSSSFKFHMSHASSKSKTSGSPSSNPKKSSNRSSGIPRSKSSRAAIAHSDAANNYPSDQVWSAEPTAITIYPFQAEKPCDLSFNIGEKITIITRTATQEDWWEGKLNGKVGIFPANYVKVN